jgi:hypothetical protein
VPAVQVHLPDLASTLWVEGPLHAVLGLQGSCMLVQEPKSWLVYITDNTAEHLRCPEHVVWLQAQPQGQARGATLAMSSKVLLSLLRQFHLDLPSYLPETLEGWGTVQSYQEHPAPLSAPSHSLPVPPPGPWVAAGPFPVNTRPLTCIFPL